MKKLKKLQFRPTEKIATQITCTLIRLLTAACSLKMYLMNLSTLKKTMQWSLKRNRGQKSTYSSKGWNLMNP